MDTTTINNTTVAETVAADYRTAEVFKKYGIDFCCGGKKTIERVCVEKNIDAAALERDLSSISNNTITGNQNYNEWTLVFLSDYIVNVHHTYVNNNLSLITGFAEKVATVHGGHNPETKEILQLWLQLVAELTTHMKKEELILFPFIKNLERNSKGELKEIPIPHFGTVRNPIRMMEHEHDLAGGLMKQIETLSNHFTAPDYACNTYKVLYAKLQEFQNDLHTHIHLENNRASVC